MNFFPKICHIANSKTIKHHYMHPDLPSLLQSYPISVTPTEIVDFANFNERLSAVDCLVANTIGVSEDYIEFIPNNEPPLMKEIYCWVWVIRPDLSHNLLDLYISDDFRFLLKSYTDNDMSRFWNYINNPKS